MIGGTEPVGSRGLFVGRRRSLAPGTAVPVRRRGVGLLFPIVAIGAGVLVGSMIARNINV